MKKIKLDKKISKINEQQFPSEIDPGENDEGGKGACCSSCCDLVPDPGRIDRNL